eukprot:4526380-Amphidinium_carterae.1
MDYSNRDHQGYITMECANAVPEEWMSAVTRQSLNTQYKRLAQQWLSNMYTTPFWSSLHKDRSHQSIGVAEREQSENRDNLSADSAPRSTVFEQITRTGDQATKERRDEDSERSPATWEARTYERLWVSKGYRKALNISWGICYGAAHRQRTIA